MEWLSLVADLRARPPTWTCASEGVEIGDVSLCEGSIGIETYEHIRARITGNTALVYGHELVGIQRWYILGWYYRHMNKYGHLKIYHFILYLLYPFYL